MFRAMPDLRVSMVRVCDSFGLKGVCHPGRGINHVKPLKGFTFPTILTGRSPHPVIAGGVEPLRGSTCLRLLLLFSRVDQHTRIQNCVRVEGALGRLERAREALGPLAIVQWALVTAAPRS